MIDAYNITPAKMNEILTKKRNMEESLYYNRIKLVLYEDPEGALRPRFRIINKKNYMEAAIHEPNFVHVYSPNAAEDNRYLHRLIDDELVSLRCFVQTPCNIKINAYSKTPSSYNAVDTFIAELGLHRNDSTPDWDNIGKKYSDMFNANVWLDDALVISGIANKFYSILPRIEIFIDYLNYATSKYQYQKIVDKKYYNKDYPIGYIGKDGRPIL
jgi:Holliday junction resolvase RusA-like endonuclease